MKEMEHLISKGSDFEKRRKNENKRIVWHFSTGRYLRQQSLPQQNERLKMLYKQKIGNDTSMKETQFVVVRKVDFELRGESF